MRNSGVCIVVAVFSAIFFQIHTLHDGLNPLVPDYHEYYYYKALREKMKESLSVNNCTLGVDIIVKVIKPSQNVIDKYGPKSYYKSKTRIFSDASKYMCESPRFYGIKMGVFKRAKGCYKVFVEDKKGNKIKRINFYGATLHPEHVRCNVTDVSSLCSFGGNSIQVVPQKLRELNSYPFLITAKNAVVSRSGMFVLPCGPFGLFSSCEAVNWGLATANLSIPNAALCLNKNHDSDCQLKRYSRVFVMTQYDDTQIGQFMQEALPKLIYHLPFLRANPDIVIHYGFTKQPVVPNYVLPHNFFHWLGLTNRLVNGSIYAEKLFMPREGGCQDIGYNAWEAVSMREMFLQELGIFEDTKFKVLSNKNSDSKKPTLLLLTRSPGRFTQNKADYTTRRWPVKTYSLFLELLKETFPNHILEIFSDQNTTLMTCPLCQAEMFHRANIVIGIHGAGLSNAIFMRPGGILVEVILDFDSRHAPLIGIFPRVSAIVGLHHYTYYVDKAIGVKVEKLVKDTYEFSKKVNLWAG
eukprot:gene16084-21847_t